MTSLKCVTAEAKMGGGGDLNTYRMLQNFKDNVRLVQSQQWNCCSLPERPASLQTRSSRVHRTLLSPLRALALQASCWAGCSACFLLQQCESQPPQVLRPGAGFPHRGAITQLDRHSSDSRTDIYLFINHDTPCNSSFSRQPKTRYLQQRQEALAAEQQLAPC